MVNKLSSGHNLRWESSRMMLPEHISAILQQKIENKKVPNPIVDEQAFNEIGIVVMESLNYTTAIKITCWKDGFFEEVIGVVAKVDMNMKQIKIEIDDDYKFLFINDIIAADRL